MTDDNACDRPVAHVNLEGERRTQRGLTSSPTPATGKAPLSVTFNGSGSSDSDGSIASWTLDFGDGSSVAGGTGPPPASSHSYAGGNYTAKLTVTDDDGATDPVVAVRRRMSRPTRVLTRRRRRRPARRR